jgi:hypothetical protein
LLRAGALSKRERGGIYNEAGGRRCRVDVRLRVGLAALGIALGVSAVGCGGGGEARPVAVQLKEWSVTPALEETKAGKLSFAVTNTGTRPHEFVLVKSDAPPQELPLRDGKVDEEKLIIEARLPALAAGGSDEVTASLSAGKYLLLCNVIERPPGQRVVSHYDEGMVAAFSVVR